MSSKQPRNPALKNFSLSNDSHSYDQNVLCSIWKELARMEPNWTDSQIDSSFPSSFPDLYSTEPVVPYFEVPLSEEEKRALQTHSFNSQKRMSIDKTKSTAAGYQHSASMDQTKTAVSSTQRHYPFPQARKPPQRHAKEEGSGLKEHVKDDPWSTTEKVELGMFDEHGVYKTSSQSQPAAALEEKTVQSSSSISVFERLREKGTVMQEQTFESHSTTRFPPYHQFPAEHLPVVHPDDRWLYRDPNGNIQGPFSNAEMIDWFMSGFFPPTLPVKRVSDPGFEALGVMISRLGHVPFVPLPTHQMPTVSGMPASNFATSAKHQNAVPKQFSALYEEEHSTFAQRQSQHHTVAAFPSQQFALPTMHEQGYANWKSEKPNYFAPESIHPQPSVPVTFDSKDLENMLIKDLRISSQPTSTSEEMTPKESRVSTLYKDTSSVKSAKTGSAHISVETPLKQTAASISSKRTDDIEPFHSNESKTGTVNVSSKALRTEASLPLSSDKSTTAWKNNVPSIPEVSFDEIQLQQKTKLEKTVSNADSLKQVSSVPVNSGISWNTAQSSSPVKSLEEIQREESMKQVSVPKKESPNFSSGSKSLSEILQSNSSRLASANVPSNLSQIAKSQYSQPPKPSISTNIPKQLPSQSLQTAPTTLSASASSSSTSFPVRNMERSAILELNEWCKKELKHIDSIDTATFVSMLLEFPSAKEMKHYIEDVLGMSSKSTAFASEFIRRAKTIISDLKTEEDEYIVVTKKGKKNK